MKLKDIKTVSEFTEYLKHLADENPVYYAPLYEKMEEVKGFYRFSLRFGFILGVVVGFILGVVVML